ncbi:MAG: HAD family hydrolase [Chloroflexi bacterium]|jgi:phosphoglycolate phosphatase-like HAD superfamily hydrolase|nr:HAD family hydrolase [Chloroflexota bacterium]
MKIIGFDFDGVFINIENEKAKLFGDVVHKYWDIDPIIASKLWLDKLGTSRKYKFDVLFWKKNHKELDEENYYEIEKIFSSILIKDYYPSADIINETFEVARDMNGKFDLTFISSGVPNLELNVLATNLELNMHFDFVLGTDEKFRSKRDHFQMISQENSCSLMIFIGDGLEDMRIAKEFNFIAIGLPANHSPQKLLDAGADFICTYSQLKQRIISLSED